MAKESKPPTVKSLLEQHERVIEKENRELLKEKDPFSLTGQDPEQALVLEQERGDMATALKDAAIRRLLYRVMMMGGLHDADGDPNPVVMAHHTGRRSLALDLYRAIKKVDAGAFYQMEREHESNLKSKEKRDAE